MSEAKKCDFCGVLYEHVGIKVLTSKWVKRYRKFDVVVEELIEDSLTIRCRDLCPECLCKLVYVKPKADPCKTCEFFEGVV